jgi:hypothetical protein
MTPLTRKTGEEEGVMVLRCSQRDAHRGVSGSCAKAGAGATFGCPGKGAFGRRVCPSSQNRIGKRHMIPSILSLALLPDGNFM